MSAVTANPATHARLAPLLGLLAPFALLHVVMLGYDLQHPDRFLHADRALERIELVRGFGAAWHGGGDMGAFLAGHGIVGDWLPQALLYLAGGQYLVIAVQLALVLLSILWVFEIGLRLGLGERRALAAAAVYGLLPHTLVFPHQLATEAIFVPLVVLSFRLSTGAGAGAALGLATLVRPITMLWPFVHAALSRSSMRARALYAAAALAPLVLWMSFMLLATGEFSMGRSAHDLGTNLYERMHKTAARLPESERPAERPAGHRRASLGEYLAFTAAHPGAAAEHSARDLATVGFKSGIERLVLDYLDLFPGSRGELQSSESGWRARVEQRGALATFGELLRAQPGLVLISAGSAALFVAFVALAVAGILCAGAAQSAAARRRRWLLAAFVLYTIATAQAVDAAQSRHRAPAEFALSLLAVAGWTALRARRALQKKNRQNDQDLIYSRREPVLGS
jgi:hypothetical protein